MTRTMLALLAGAAVGAAAVALAQSGHGHGKGSTVKTLSAVDVAEPFDGKPARVTTLEVSFEPGAASPPHRHPGPVFGYVLEGEFETKVGDGPVRTLKAGETFYEPAMALHAISRNPTDKARTRVLAVMLHPRDAKVLVIPESADKK
jgi:quercetin dioxygenase-like cupin family protein